MCEFLGASGLIGAAVVGMSAFWLSLLGIVVSRYHLLIACGGLAAVGLWRITKLRERWRSWRSAVMVIARSDHRVLLAGTGVAVLFTALVSMDAVGTRLWRWDAVAVWGLKAKVLAHSPLATFPEYFSDVTLSFSHLDYPLMIPALMATTYGAIGVTDDVLGKAIFPFIALSFALFLFGTLRWQLRSRLAASAIALVVLMLPPTSWWAGSGYADFPLMVFHGASIYYVLRWSAEGHRGDLGCAILFSAACAFTKNEGLPLAMLNVVAVAAFHLPNISKAFRSAAIFGVGFVLLHLPWFVWSRQLPRTYENYGGKLNIDTFVTNIERIRIIGFSFAQELCNIQGWGFFWILLFVMAAVGFRAFGQRRPQILWALMLGHFLIYALAYVITPWELSALIPITIGRLFLHIMPVAAYLIAAHWDCIMDRGSAKTG